MRRRLIALLAPALLLAVPAPGSASLILALDLPTLVSRADQISVVDVVSVTSAWNETHDRITTTIDVKVVDSWKGAAAPATHVQVVQPGGTVGEIEMRVDGMPRFQVGERTLLFLRLHGGGARASVVGMAQGKRPVTREANSDRWMVSAPDRAGADFVRTTPASAAIFTARPRTLTDLRTEVRALVGAGAGTTAPANAPAGTR
jgi:hypothetical protein